MDEPADRDRTEIATDGTPAPAATNPASGNRRSHRGGGASSVSGIGAKHVGAIWAIEDLIRYAVAVILMAIAALVLYHTVEHAFVSHDGLDQIAVNALNGVLFAIIVLETMSTVLAHFDHGGFQLQPFLIIATISAVREILSVGAQLTLGNGTHLHDSDVHLALLELGVNALVVLVLAVALTLVRKGEAEVPAP